MTEFTESIFKGSTIASSQIFSICIDMSSWPWAFFISKDIIVHNRISLPEILIESRGEAVTYDLSGSAGLLTMEEHCKLKNSLK